MINVSIFEKFSNVKFHDISTSGSRVICDQKGRRDAANTLTS